MQHSRTKSTRSALQARLTPFNRWVTPESSIARSRKLTHLLGSRLESFPISTFLCVAN
jgi:hypothetical protein